MPSIHNEPRSIKPAKDIIKQLTTVLGTWIRWRERWAT